MKEQHGADACGGIDKLCLTDYADSQYSAPEPSIPEAPVNSEWVARKVEKGGGTVSVTDAVVVKRKKWISPKVRLRLYHSPGDSDL